MAVQFTALPRAPLPKVQDRPEIAQSSSSSGPRHTQCRSSHGTVMMSWAVIQGRPAPGTLCHRPSSRLACQRPGRPDWNPNCCTITQCRTCTLYTCRASQCADRQTGWLAGSTVRRLSRRAGQEVAEQHSPICPQRQMGCMAHCGHCDHAITPRPDACSHPCRPGARSPGLPQARLLISPPGLTLCPSIDPQRHQKVLD